jgi:hypothetical protein
MNTVRFNVCPRGKGYIAQSMAPEITAMGASPEEAVESARLMALVLFARGPRPEMLVVYLDEPGIRKIVMQPLTKTFTLATATEETGWRYMASVTDDTASIKAFCE